MADLSDDELLAELGVEIEAKPTRKYTPLEERVIAGFEDIQRFYEKNGRPPQHGEQRDIFERIYAVRLDRLRGLTEYHELLAAMDVHQLLTASLEADKKRPELMDDDTLLSALDTPLDPETDITKLKHVQSREERRATEEIANRERCDNFDQFEPLFLAVQKDLDSGNRVTREFVKDAGFLKADIVKGQFFILGGQIAYVADEGEIIKAPNGQLDARLRVIYSNGTESNLLRRSLQRALYKDETGRRISDPEAGPLFTDKAEEGDIESGTIYVLRSQSDHPTVAANRDLIHKIGVTGGDVKSRIANAERDTTYLLAGVDIIATYKLININRKRLEAIIHNVFSPARLDLEIKDRFGQSVKPREWFLVPLDEINEAVERIKDGSIIEYVYDPESAQLLSLSGKDDG